MSRGKLRAIRRRIISTQSTMQITRAMEMVATAKVKKIEKLILPVREYAKYTERVLKKIPPHEDSLYLKEGGKIVVVVITPDMGLCGAFPIELGKKAKEVAKDLKENFYGFIVVGTKGEIILREEKIIHERSKLYDTPTQDHAAYILDDLVDLLEKGEITGAKIVYGKFKNALIQLPDVIDLIPIKYESKPDPRYEFEPAGPELFDEIAYLYLLAKMYLAMFETKISELYARKNAMKNATDNAKNLIDRLTLEYNKARQASITQELIEIVNGAQALQE